MNKRNLDMIFFKKYKNIKTINLFKGTIQN